MKKYLFALVAIVASGLLMAGCQLNVVDEYSIGVALTSNGKVEVSKTTALSGATVTLTMTPDSGYALASIAVTGVQSTDIHSTVTPATNVVTATFPMPAQNATVSSSFTKAFAITNLSAAGGTAKANYTAAAAGTTVTVAVAPKTGYAFAHSSLKANTATVPATPQVVGSTVAYSYSFTMPASDVALSGTFTVNAPHAATVAALTDASSNASVRLPGGLSSANFNANDIVQLAVDVPVGYNLTSLTADGVEVSKIVDSGTTYYYFIMPAAAVSITATIAASATAYTLTGSVTGSGTIGFFSDAAHANTITSATLGTTVFVTANPSNGYSLGSLKVNGLDIATSRSFIMPPANTTVSATFAVDAATYSIATPTSSNGTITANLSSAAYGTLVVLHAVPSATYALVKNSIKITTAAGTITVPNSNGQSVITFAMPAANVTAITGTFQIPGGVDVDTATHLWAPIWGGSGSWDAGSLTAVFGGAWVSIGWPWTGSINFDYSAYDKIVFTLASPTTAKLSAHVQYSNGTAETDVEVPAGSSSITLNLDSAGKAFIPQIWIQSEIATTVQFTSIQLY